MRVSGASALTSLLLLALVACGSLLEPRVVRQPELDPRLPPPGGCAGVGTPSGDVLRYRDGTEVCLSQAEIDRIPLLIKKGDKAETRRTETDWLGRRSEVVEGGDDYLDYRDIAEYLRRQGKEVVVPTAAPSR